MKKQILLGFVCLLFIAMGALWFFQKPVRVLLPSIAPVYFVEDGLYIDDQSKVEVARALLQNAFTFVNENIGSIDGQPNVIFCAHTECSEYFGLVGVRGYTIGTHSIVIKPEGWQDYILRHELIHHLQNERLGQLARYQKPEWFIEGMAYSLSLDPRKPLETVHQSEQNRAKFEKWYKTIKQQEIWALAEKL